VRKIPDEGFKLFAKESIIKTGYGMCCAIPCFEAGHDIQVEDEALKKLKRTEFHGLKLYEHFVSLRVFMY
jgi:hypothetical protein